MGFLRGRSHDVVSNIDAELRDAVSRLHRTPEKRDAEREVLLRHIDDLLERRLHALDEIQVRDFEQLISAG
jgi:hypothetical protein